MRRILTFEFVQNHNNYRSGFSSVKKGSGMVSNLLKRWRDDFATLKRQRDGFGAFRKETGCHPASSHPTSNTGYKFTGVSEFLAASIETFVFTQ
jgi:hypothetical protein